MSETDPRSAHPYLLDGRRVTISDLLQAGLLADQQKLTFHRPRKNQTYHAEVTAEGGGGIRLVDSERVFRSPSRAACAAVGSGNFDGWSAWQVEGEAFLDGLRQQLLDQAARQPQPAPETDKQTPRVPTAAERHERLKNARQATDSQKRPVSLSVRDLLSWWGASGRGAVRDQIEAELANHGLVTSPHFEQVSLDTTIQLVRVPSESAAAAPAAGDEEGQTRDPGPTVGTIDSALDGVTSIKPTADLNEAITLLLLNDFSQLPVMSGPHQLLGALTWKSIAQARHRNGDCTLAQAIVEAREVRYDHDLIDVLPVIAQHDFVLVRGPKNDIAGIVTASDVALAYGTMASPFLLVGELDQRLRALIINHFSIADVADVCDRAQSRNLTSFDTLTFGDYVNVLSNPACWEKLGWPLDRAAFTRRLDEVRKIRNDLMHFNPDPLPDTAEPHIRAVIDILRSYTD
ncbi:restriction system modified-DNA reader domain-containing protein [Streptomyces sp. NPDC004230]